MKRGFIYGASDKSGARRGCRPAPRRRARLPRSSDVVPPSSIRWLWPVATVVAILGDVTPEGVTIIGLDGVQVDVGAGEQPRRARPEAFQLGPQLVGQRDPGVCLGIATDASPARIHALEDILEQVLGGGSVTAAEQVRGAEQA